MRTTVESPDELLRRAKVQAALQGRPLKDLVADGLKLLLRTSGARSPGTPHRTPFPIIKPKDPARRLTLEIVAALRSNCLTRKLLRMAALPDINVLVALSYGAHVHHVTALGLAGPGSG
jgi:hypothetical protein